MTDTEKCKSDAYLQVRVNIRTIAVEFGLPKEPDFYDLVTEATQRADEQYLGLPEGTQGRSFEDILMEIGNENGIDIPQEAAQRAGQAMLDAHDDYKECEVKDAAALPAIKKGVQRF